MIKLKSYEFDDFLGERCEGNARFGGDGDELLVSASASDSMMIVSEVNADEKRGTGTQTGKARKKMMTGSVMALMGGRRGHPLIASMSTDRG